MKKIVLSAVAVAAMSTFAIAGGDITPVVETEEVAPVVTDSGFYLGLAYGMSNLNADISINGFFDGDIDKGYNSLMLQAGYKVNQYVAVEGRYWFGFEESVTIAGDSIDASGDSWGIYVKPMYPVTEDFNVYALFGYASSEATVKVPGASDLSVDDNGFSWGLGAEYELNTNVSLFVDYTSIYSGTPDEIKFVGGDIDLTNSSVNFGATYRF